MKLLHSRSHKKVLKKLSSKFPEIKEAIIVSNEGMPLKSTLSNEYEHVKISGIALAILSAAKRIVSEMEKGRFKQLTIKGSKGYILGYWLSRNKLLFALSEKDVNLDSII